MTGPGVSASDGAALWQVIAAGEAASGLPPLSPQAVDRFAELASPVLADHLLGGNVLDPQTVAQSHLNNRFRHAAQRACLALIGEAGIPVVAIKGYALAHIIYPDPALRAVGDIDVLVRAEDRDRLLRRLTDEGYTFEPLPPPPWGFISEASYAPFVSPDSTCNLDVHIHPDCYPAFRSLTTEAVFAAAENISDGGMTFLAPSVSHAFLLCATNVAKDKFSTFSARKIADAMRLAHTGQVDWTRLDELARAGDYQTPFRVFVKLLGDLGLPRTCLPAYVQDPLPKRRAREYERMLHETLCLYPHELGLAQTLRRELLLSTEPGVGLHNAGVRLGGLFRRRDGVPVVVNGLTG